MFSPEIFDYRRPPSTPIRKGTTPIRCASNRRSIIKATPLKTTREESQLVRQNTPVKELDFTSSFQVSAYHSLSFCNLTQTNDFQLSPSPEPEKTKDFEEIEPVDNGGTPQKSASRRKSSAFKPKKLSMSNDDTPTKRRRTTGNVTPKKRLQM